MQWLGLPAAPLLAALTFAALPDSYIGSEGIPVALGHAGRVTAAVAVWMAVWWITETIPIYATALLPLALLPLTGARTIRQSASPYGHELIYLFLGGFLLALAMERWGLHRRVAVRVLRAVGTEPRRMVGGFMVVTAGLSMWVSNTATTLMMLPIATSTLEQLRGGGGRPRAEEARPGADGLETCLLLGIAYAASIGGLATLTGTPPNLFLASFAKEQLGLEITFVGWMAIGVPLALAFLPIAWLLLTRVLFPVGASSPPSRSASPALPALGPLSPGERATAVVFLATAGCWILRPLLAGLGIAGTRPLAGLTDTGIAMLAAVALFVIPVDRKRRVFVMDWATAQRVPWGVLLLFGGGLSLAAALQANGVSEWVGNQVRAFGEMPPVFLAALTAGVTIFLTELTSNTATATTLLPILAGLAPGLGVPVELLIVPAAVAASCAFMLPVATPPNAIVFGSGLVTIPQMVRAGFWLNWIGIVLITGITQLVAVPVLGVRP